MPEEWLWIWVLWRNRMHRYALGETRRWVYSKQFDHKDIAKRFKVVASELKTECGRWHDPSVSLQKEESASCSSSPRHRASTALPCLLSMRTSDSLHDSYHVWKGNLLSSVCRFKCSSHAETSSQTDTRKCFSSSPGTPGPSQVET